MPVNRPINPPKETILVLKGESNNKATSRNTQAGHLVSDGDPFHLPNVGNCVSHHPDNDLSLMSSLPLTRLLPQAAVGGAHGGVVRQKGK